MKIVSSIKIAGNVEDLQYLFLVWLSRDVENPVIIYRNGEQFELFFAESVESEFPPGTKPAPEAKTEKLVEEVKTKSEESSPEQKTDEAKPIPLTLRPPMTVLDQGVDR